MGKSENLILNMELNIINSRKRSFHKINLNKRKWNYLYDCCWFLNTPEVDSKKQGNEGYMRKSKCTRHTGFLTKLFGHAGKN